jgi:hypothetical protein
MYSAYGQEEIALNGRRRAMILIGYLPHIDPMRGQQTSPTHFLPMSRSSFRKCRSTQPTEGGMEAIIGE